MVPFKMVYVVDCLVVYRIEAPVHQTTVAWFESLLPKKMHFSPQREHSLRFAASTSRLASSGDHGECRKILTTLHERVHITPDSILHDYTLMQSHPFEYMVYSRMYINMCLLFSLRVCRVCLASRPW